MDKHIVITEDQNRKHRTTFTLLFIVSMLLVISLGGLTYMFINPVKEVVRLPAPPAEIVYKQSFVPVYKKLSLADFQELDCMARNVYHEARGELLAGKLSSALSVRNRMEDKKFPDSACGVVYHKVSGVAQYSWIDDGLSDAANDVDAWSEAMTVAYKVLYLGAEDIIEGSLFYHKDDGKTKFSDKHYAAITKVGAVGKHVFYRRK